MTTIQYLGRSYEIICAPEHKDALLKALEKLNQSAVEVRREGSLSHDGLILISALNAIAKLIPGGSGDHIVAQGLGERLVELEKRMDLALELE